MTYHSTADPMPTAYVQFSGRGSPRIQVQQALTFEHRKRGLMQRGFLPGHRGMLLSWETDGPRRLWMRDTHIPLDMIFIAAGGTIAGIIQNVTPLSDAPQSVGNPAQHVLEVNAGFVAQHGVAVGQRISILPARGLLAATRSETP